MKFNQVLNNFTAGQWSEKMLANSTMDQYKNSCKVLENMFVLKQGGAYKRPGTLYQSLDASYQTRLNNATYIKLIPYRIASTNYILVLTGGVPDSEWFYINLSDYSCADVTSGMSAPGDALGQRILNVQYAQVGNILYLTMDGRIPQVFSLGYPFTIATNMNSYDTMMYNGITFANAYRAYPYTTPSTFGKGIPATISAPATTGTITLTASGGYFYSNDVSRYLKLTASGATGVVKINSVFGAPSTTCTATVIVTLPAATAYGSASGTSWEKSEWGLYFGNPSAITSFEQRLYWSGHKSVTGDYTTLSNKVWASDQGNVNFMMEIPLADDPDFTTYAQDNSRPFSFVPSIGDSSTVKVLSSSKALFVGMDGADLVAKGVQGSLGPNDISLESPSSFGASAVQPVKVDNFNTYVGRNKKSIRDIIYTYENEQFKSVDISFMSDSLFYGTTITKLVSAFLNSSSFLFVLCADGSVKIASLDRESGIYAWAPLSFSGTSLQVKDIICIPRGNSDESDAVYFLIKRTINGSTKVYLEKLSPIYELSTYTTPAGNFFYYLDSGKVITSPGSTTITATHLAGETVHVFANGNYKGTKTVSAGGTFTLDAVYTTVLFGLGYDATLVPSPIRTNTQVGNSTGMAHKVSTIYVKFWNTISATYGDYERAEEYDIEFRPSTTIAQDSIPLFTGEKRLQFPPGFSREKQLVLKSTLPFPFNVLSVALDGVAYD